MKRIIFLLTLSLAMGSGAFGMFSKINNNIVMYEEKEKERLKKLRKGENLGNLPEELLIYVLEFFYQTPQDLLRILLTCSAFYLAGFEIITNENAKYTPFERLEFLKNRFMSEKQHHEMLESMYDFFLCLNVNQIKTLSLLDYYLNPDHFKLIIKHCPEIEKLEVAVCEILVPDGEKLKPSQIYGEEIPKNLRSLKIFFGSPYEKSDSTFDFSQSKAIIEGVLEKIEKLTVYYKSTGAKVHSYAFYTINTNRTKTLKKSVAIPIFRSFNFSEPANLHIGRYYPISMLKDKTITRCFVNCRRDNLDAIEDNIKEVSLICFDSAKNDIEKLISIIPKTIERLTIDFGEIEFTKGSEPCSNKETVYKNILKLIKNDKLRMLKDIKIISRTYCKKALILDDLYKLREMFPSKNITLKIVSKSFEKNLFEKIARIW